MSSDGFEGNHSFAHNACQEQSAIHDEFPTRDKRSYQNAHDEKEDVLTCGVVQAGWETFHGFASAIGRVFFGTLLHVSLHSCYLLMQISQIRRDQGGHRDIRKSEVGCS